MTESTENTIFVGKKGTMSYVLAVVTQFNQGAKDVTIKARGRAISRAVDVAEIVKNKFVTDADLGNIVIGTEELTTDDGRQLKVSSIEIPLNRTSNAPIEMPQKRPVEQAAQETEEANNVEEQQEESTAKTEKSEAPPTE